MTKAYILVLAALFIGSCGGSKENDRLIFPDEMLSLPKAYTTDKVFASDQLMSSYDANSGVLSVVDITTQSLAWQKEITGYSQSFMLPSGNEVLLASREELLILGKNNQSVRFPFEESYQYVDLSLQDLTFAFASSSGKKLKIVRNLDNGNWQEESISIPWAGDVPTEASDGDRRYFLRPLLSEDGRTLTALSLIDGRYAVYRSPAAFQEINPTGQRCSGTAGGSWEEPLYSMADISPDGSLAFLGTSKGRILFFNINDSCQDMDQLPGLNLENEFPVLSATVLNTGLVAITQSGGFISLINIEDPDNPSIMQSGKVDCDFPVSLVEPSENEVLVNCRMAKNTTIENITPSTEFESVYRYLYINTDTAIAVIHSFELNDDKVSGKALSPKSKELFYTTYNSLGYLGRWSYLSNQIGGKANLFIERILD